MTREEAKRSAILSVAYEESSELAQAVADPGEPGQGYTQILLELGMHECGNDPYDGGSGGERIYVDMKTAARIVAAARVIIAEELRELGVEADD